MVYCQQCNTANRDNSRFCNECGASLKDAKRRCQACGTLNAADKKMCTNCGARLQIIADAEPEELPEEEAPSAPVRPPAIPPTILAPAPPNAGLPDWLSAMQKPDRPGGEPADDVASAETASLPLWLQDVGPAVASSGAPQTAQSAPTPPEQDFTVANGESLPSWLQELRSGPSSTQTKMDAASEPQQLGTPPQETPLPATTTQAGEELPAWLRELRSGPASVPAPDAAPELTAADTAAPDWLSDLPKRELAPEASVPLNTEFPVPTAVEPASETSVGELPDWLKELASGQPAVSQPPTPLTIDMSDVAVEELPSWLKPAAPSTTESPAPPVAAPPMVSPAAIAGSGLAPAELPAWLTEIRSGGRPSVAAEPIETSGLLAGVRGALPVESVFVAPHKYVENASTRASLPITGFAELHAPTPTPPVADEKPAKPRRFKWPWQLMLSLAILGAISGSFLQLPGVMDARGTTIANYQPSRDFFQTVDLYNSRESKGIVLVAFDYTAGSRDELDLQARPVLRHLFENQQHVVTVSSLPDGGKLAQDQLNARNPSNTPFAYPYRYGETHLNLGYISGGEAALRLLTQDQIGLAGVDYRDHRSLSDWPIINDWTSFANVELLIVFSDDAVNINQWIEQVSTQPGAPHKPIVVGVSKAVEPAIMPYYSSKQINGLLAGVHGACEYENDLIEPNVAVACAALDAQSYASVVLLVIIGLSLPAMLFVRKR
jgi:double zinc ribbon protein